MAYDVVHIAKCNILHLQIADFFAAALRARMVWSRNGDSIFDESNCFTANASENVHRRHEELYALPLLAGAFGCLEDSRLISPCATAFSLCAFRAEGLHGSSGPLSLVSGIISDFYNVIDGYQKLRPTSPNLRCVVMPEAHLLLAVGFQ